MGLSIRASGRRKTWKRRKTGASMAGADPDRVSRAGAGAGLSSSSARFGSGNHFLEIEVVEEIFDPVAAAAFGLEQDEIAVLIHSGFPRAWVTRSVTTIWPGWSNHMGEMDLNLPDRQLACAYLESQPGRDYMAAMACRPIMHGQPAGC